MARAIRIVNHEFLAESMFEHQVSMFPEHSDVNDRKRTLIAVYGHNVAALTAINGFLYTGGRIICFHCAKGHIFHDHIVQIMNDTQYPLNLHETHCAYIKLASKIQGDGVLLCSDGCNRQKVQVICLPCGHTFCIGCALKQLECLYAVILQ